MTQTANANNARKRVLVTGCCGTVGGQLIDQLLASPDAGNPEIIGIDNNESKLFFLQQKYPDADFYLTDLRDERSLRTICHGIDTIFHLAALKHVVVCEKSPTEAVQTNINGVENIINAARLNRVGKVIFTSSDKAVNPTSVMGTSKLMGERLITAASYGPRDSSTIFSSTRFGNVLGSNGSVVPIFAEQIKNGGPVTLTTSDMTRFIMTPAEAARLVIESADIAVGGEVLITKMPVIKISDLARAMIAILAPVYGHDPEQITISEIGAKPGEKFYEELMSDEETRRAIELNNYFSVLPAFRNTEQDKAFSYPGNTHTEVTNPYNSAHEAALSVGEVQSYLVENAIIDLDGLNHR